MRTVRGISFDEEPLPELNSEAIDFRVASERTPRAARTQLARLVHAGQVIVVGSSAKDPRRGYHLKTGS